MGGGHRRPAGPHLVVVEGNITRGELRVITALVALVHHRWLIVRGGAIKRLLRRVSAIERGWRRERRSASLRLLLGIVSRSAWFWSGARNVTFLLARRHQRRPLLRRLETIRAVAGVRTIGTLVEALRGGRVTPEQFAARSAIRHMLRVGIVGGRRRVGRRRVYIAARCRILIVGLLGRLRSGILVVALRRLRSRVLIIALGSVKGAAWLRRSGSRRLLLRVGLPCKARIGRVLRLAVARSLSRVLVSATAGGPPIGLSLIGTASAARCRIVIRRHRRLSLHMRRNGNLAS